MMSLVIPGFDLEQMYNAGQASHWKKVFLSDRMLYVVISNRTFTALEQKRNRIIFSCSSNQVYDYWFDYFDLRQDYVELNADVHRSFGTFGRMADNTFGMHVLKLEPWEAMLEVLVMRKCSPEKARENLWLLCDIAGKHKESALSLTRFKWSEMPDSEDIIKHKKKLLLYPQFEPVVKLAEKVDKLGEFAIDSMVLDTNSVNMGFLRSFDVFTPQEARMVLSWGLGRRNVIALSKTQVASFTRHFGSSPLEFMRSNKHIRDGYFHGRMDYFSQLVRSDYINHKQRKSNGNSR